MNFTLKWHGDLSFGIYSKQDPVLLFNPSVSREGTDPLILYSMPELAEDRLKRSFYLPGEYEARAISFIGMGVHDVQSKKTITIFRLTLTNNVTLAHLGFLSNKDSIPAPTRELLNKIDVLLLPLGKDYLSVKGGVELTHQLEPRIIIPIGIFGKDVLDELKKEVGDGQEQTSLRLTRGVSESDISRLIVLTPDKL